MAHIGVDHVLQELIWWRKLEQIPVLGQKGVQLKQGNFLVFYNYFRVHDFSLQPLVD